MARFIISLCCFFFFPSFRGLCLDTGIMSLQSPTDANLLVVSLGAHVALSAVCSVNTPQYEFEFHYSRRAMSTMSADIRGLSTEMMG